MRTIKAEVHIDAPKDVVWEIIGDFGGTWKYNPNVTHSYALTDANGGVGAERHCDLVFSGATVQERIVDWDEAGSYALEIFDGDKQPPIKDVVARLAVDERGSTTVATGTLTYSPKYGPIGAVMDRFMFAPKLSTLWTSIFAGLKHYAETGEVVDRDTVLDRYDVRLVAA